MVKKAGYSCRVTTGKQSSSRAEHISPWESSITLLARPGSRVAIEQLETITIIEPTTFSSLGVAGARHL